MSPRGKCRISTYLSLSQLYAIAVKDLIRKSDRSYKVKSRNSTVEYTLNRLEPGGKYHVVVQLGNMSKDASIKVTTGEWAEATCAGRLLLALLRGWQTLPTGPRGPAVRGLTSRVL